MKFIHCFNKDMKNELQSLGFKLISQSKDSQNKDLYIFENNLSHFNFSELDRSQFIFSNKMVF